MTKHSPYERAQRAAETERVKQIEAAWYASIRGPLPPRPDMAPGTLPNPPRPGREPKPVKEDKRTGRGGSR